MTKKWLIRLLIAAGKDLLITLLTSVLTELSTERAGDNSKGEKGLK